MDQKGQEPVPEKFNWSGLPNEIKWLILKFAGHKAFKIQIPSNLRAVQHLDLTPYGSVKVSPDGKLLAVTEVELINKKDSQSPYCTTVKIINIETGKCSDKHLIHEQAAIYSSWHKRTATCLSWHPEGSKLAIGVTECGTDKIFPGWNWLVIWDLTSNQIMKESYSHKIKDIDWCPEGRRILTAAYDGANIWDAAAGKKKLQIAQGPFNKAQWNKQGNKILLCGEGVFIVWDLEKEPVLDRIFTVYGFSDAKIEAVDWHPQGDEIAVGWNDGTISVKNIHTKKERKFSHFEGGIVTAITYSPDGKVLLSAENKSATINFWNAQSEEVEDVLFTKDRVRDIVWLTDKAIMCLSDQALRKYLLEFDVSSQKKLKRYSPDKSKVVDKVRIDPLKLYLTLQMLAQLCEKKKQDSEIPDFALPKFLAQLKLKTDYELLQKKGISENQVKKMISEDKDVLLGQEEYSYYLFVKEKLGDALKDIKVGLKGRDTCIDDFLREKSENENNSWDCSLM